MIVDSKFIDDLQEENSALIRKITDLEIKIHDIKEQNTMLMQRLQVITLQLMAALSDDDFLDRL